MICRRDCFSWLSLVFVWLVLFHCWIMVRSVISALVATTQDHLQTKVDQEHGCQGASNCYKKPTCCANCYVWPGIKQCELIGDECFLHARWILVAHLPISVSELNIAATLVCCKAFFQEKFCTREKSSEFNLNEDTRRPIASHVRTVGKSHIWGESRVKGANLTARGPSSRAKLR